jgi:hydrogenase large subunit
MPVIKVVDPVPRIEGHLKVTLTIDTIGGVQKVTDAESTGNMYRGFENFMVGQEPLDAPLITQRVCGVCPTAHAMAAVHAMDAAANVQPTPNGRIMRNLINGAEYLHSHLLHSYHLALQDYIDMTAAVNQGPWAPLYGGDRRVTGTDLTNLVNSYLAALAMRRKAHTIGAILAGKQPHAASIIGGGCSATPSASDVTTMTSLLNEIKSFIDNTYLPDMTLLFNTYYSDYFSIGAGCGKLLAYGVFPQGTESVNNLLLKRGIYNGTSIINVMDQDNIAEDVLHSWYTGADNLQPFNGVTNPIITPATSPPTPFPGKAGAYSWLKSPRYKTNGVTPEVYEVGPLARMVVNGDYPIHISAADREMARAYEAQKVANAMLGWLTDLGNNLSGPSFVPCETPANGSAAGLTEAIRGAIGHWVKYDVNKKISHYQIITPTCWNASPRDAGGNRGPMEQALIDTPILNATEPVEALRVIHSFDPCLACAVHVIRDDGKTISKFVVE